ncbi:MAG: DUF2911 domain-containing protein [Cyclobacteriaceae bacterium]
MKNLFILLTLSFFWACSTPEKKEEEQEKTDEHAAHSQASNSEKKSLSPRTASMSNVGDNHIHIDYGSPSKRGRMIFGGLVGYGTVWATGAHKATYINFGKDVTINGVEIESGKYGLFTIPGETEWTIIINKDWDMHLADDYNEANDLVRIQALVEQLDEVVESLTFEVQESDDKSGKITLKWDQTAVSFDLVNQ